MEERRLPPGGGFRESYDRNPRTRVWSRFLATSARHIRRAHTGAVKATPSRGQLPFPASPEYWSAAAFTPTANHTVTKIEVGVGYVEGTNGLTLALYNDASGVPGTQIKAFAVSGLPNFGSCCMVVSATDYAGIAVTAGTQYSVVMKTAPKPQHLRRLLSERHRSGRPRTNRLLLFTGRKRIVRQQRQVDSRAVPTGAGLCCVRKVKLLQSCRD